MKDSTKRQLNMLKFKVVEKKPEIMLYSGIGCVIGGFVWGCMSSRKIDGALEDLQAIVDDSKKYLAIAEEENNVEEIAIEKKNIQKAYINGGAEVAKLYVPPVALTSAGIGLIVGSHSEMKSRNMAVTAALTAATNAFSEYKKRVIDHVGAEMEEEIRLDLKKETVTEEVVDEKTGRKKKVKKEEKVMDKNKALSADISSVFFDELSPYYQDNGNYNYMFLKAAQCTMNDQLRVKGILFENDVRRELGLPITKEGAVLGWKYDEECPEKTYIDFGCFNMDTTQNRRFLEGIEPVVLLRFNVQGNVWSFLKDAQTVASESEAIYE